MSVVFALSGVLLIVIVGSFLFTHAYRRRVEKLYPPVGRFLDVQGSRLHYLDTGPSGGESLGTVVILHGASSNLVESMLGVGSHLQGRYRVLAFDRPGHGWSTRPGDITAAEPARQAAIIAEALRKLDVRDAVMVGHSWSGLVVPNLALDHRDVTGAILMLSGLSHPWPGGYIGWYRRLVTSWPGRVLPQTLAIPMTLLLRRQAERRTFAPQAAPPGFLERAFVPLAFRPGAYAVNGQDFAVMFEAVTRQSIRYGDIRVPTVVVAGDMDEIVWTDLHSRSFARDVPGAELVILPGVGHMPQYAQPERVILAIEALAARVAAAKAQETEAAADQA
jgi:pimeloyl-ACP methyl ester carboxylesterase